jgi:hypothetical protein
LNARRRAILTACLSRTDRGDPLDSILRDHNDEGDWLRQHLALSNDLTVVCGPSSEAKNRAHQLILNAPARWDPPATVATRLRFAVAMAQAAVIIVGCLTLTAGAAAAVGVNLRSVPRHVVETLLVPLPPLAENIQESVVLGPEGQAAAEDSGGGERADSQSGAGSAVKDDAEFIVGVSGGTVPTDASAPVPGDPPSHANPSGNEEPNGNPSAINFAGAGGDPPGHAGGPQGNDPPGTGNNGNPPGSGGDPSGGENQGGDHGIQPGPTNPPGPNPGHDGQPRGDAQNGSNCPGNQADTNQQGQIGPNGGGANEHNNGGSSGSKPGNGNAASKSGPT